jgi:hypothetical protein
MFQFLRGIALIGGIMMNCGAAIAASDVTTANGLMPGCRHHLQTDSPPADGRLPTALRGLEVADLLTHGSVLNRVLVPKSRSVG